MYVNYRLLFELKLEPIDFHILVAAKNAGTEDMEAVLAMLVQEDSRLQILRERGYIKDIKGKKNDSELAKIRIDTKGKKVLEDLAVPTATEGDLKMFDFLSEMYLSHEDEDRVIGNKKKVKLYCVIMRNYLSLSLHRFYWLCWLFLEQAVYTKKLENIFFDSNKNRYGKFENNIEDSPLYQWYDENKDEVVEFWKKKEV